MGTITTQFSSCFVCCKKVKLGPEVNKKRKLCEQFLVLMSRYLNLNRGDDHDDYGSEKTLDIKNGFGKKNALKRRRKRGRLFSCDHCLSLIESVCAIYKDWSVLQVKLNGSIKSMARLMLDVSVSTADCAIEVTEDFEEAVDFRARFIKQALKKPNSKDFPHLALNRLSTNFSSRVAVSETATNKTTAVNSKSDCKVVPKQEVEEKSEDDLDIADFDAGSPGTGIWEPNRESDVEMNDCEKNDDDDYYDEDDNNEIETPEVDKLKVSQKKKTESTDDDVDKPFKCKTCGKGFAQAKYQREHEQRHAHPFRCRLCARRFSLKISLQAHEKIHKEGKANQFQCGVCSRFFLQWTDCTYHIRRVHKGKGDVLRGGVKWPPTPGSDNTKEMKKINTQSTDDVDVDKPFKCQICGKGFAQAKYQREHEQRHAHPFRCRLCSRRFSLKINLRAHEKIHKEGKANQFQCGVCSRFFLQWTDCTYHIRRVHKGKGDVLRGGVIVKWQPGTDNKNEEKSLKCKFCPRSFSRVLEKANHEKTHRKKSFKCPHCEMTFKRVSVLNRHVDKHLKPYECGLCGSRFSQRDNCRNHQSMVHKVIDGVILKISDGVTNDTSLMTALKNEANRNLHDDDDGGNTASASADKASETLEPPINSEIAMEPTPDDNGNESDNANADSDSGSADIWKPGNDAEDDDDDAKNEGYSQDKDESNCVQVKGDEGSSKRKRRRFTNREIEELRSRDPLPFKCEECGKGFPLPSFISQHVRLTHRKKRNKGIPYQCDTCGKRFNQPHHLKRHLDGRPSTCNKIISRFISKHDDLDPNTDPERIIIEVGDLQEVTNKRRIRIKKEELEAIRTKAEAEGDPLPFKCTECDRAFAVHAMLLRHRRASHKKGILHRCSICQRTFSELYRFKRHWNIHTNARPFKCRFCLEKSFNSHNTRNVHEMCCNANPMKGQIDVKKHKCSLCGKGFEYPSLLQTHARVKHGLPKAPSPQPAESSSGSQCEEWICEKCGKVFPNQRVLYTHMLKELGKGERLTITAAQKSFQI